MADVITQGRTSLGPEEVIVRAVQFFSTGNWRPTSQSARTATFQGKPPIPWFMLLLTVIGFMACLLPGIIMYIMVIRKMYRFHNLVVTANPVSGGSEIVLQYPRPRASWRLGFLKLCRLSRSDPWFPRKTTIASGCKDSREGNPVTRAGLLPSGVRSSWDSWAWIGFTWDTAS